MYTVFSIRVIFNNQLLYEQIYADGDNDSDDDDDASRTVRNVGITTAHYTVNKPNHWMSVFI